MVLRLFTQEQGDHRLFKAAQTVRDSVPHRLRGRLGYDNQHFYAVILFHSLNHIHHGDSAHLSGQIPSAGPDGVFHALPQTVYNRCQLLDSGSRRPYDSDWPRSYMVGKRNGHALDDSGAAVRPHDRQSLFMSLFL